MIVNINDLKQLGNKIYICTESELIYNIDIINAYMNKEASRTTSVYITNIKTVASKYDGVINNSTINLNITNNYILILEITEV